MQKETPQLAERLEAYQLRAKDVLAEAFLGGKQMFATPQDYPSALRALADAEEKRLALEAEAKANAPLVLFAKGVEGSSNSILVRDFAKILRQNSILVGGNRLFEWFRENGFLIRQQGRDYNMPTQRSVEMRLFEVKETVISPQNEALTPEELQGMCGHPVFVVSTEMGNFWALVNMNSVYVDARKCFLFDNFDAEYGKIWTAYRRPPEGENLE